MPSTMLTSLPNSQGKVLHLQMKVPHLKIGEDLGGKVYACVSNSNHQFDTREDFAKLTYFTCKKADDDGGKLKTHRFPKDDLPCIIPAAKFVCSSTDYIIPRDKMGAAYDKIVYKLLVGDQTFILSGKKSRSNMQFNRTPEEWRGVA